VAASGGIKPSRQAEWSRIVASLVQQVSEADPNGPFPEPIASVGPFPFTLSLLAGLSSYAARPLFHGSPSERVIGSAP